ncbi:MAG: PstS family phosphate ABC transporter substrate-binding protein [Polyangiaceae bacterium]|nr:PstS family phosphate ABC transporter substrate-binding protein [Polyangiaceae bacterium]
MRHAASYLFAAAALTAACSRSAPRPPPIKADGSSTVYPISEAVAEEWKKVHPTQVTVGISGTGGGFKRFCARETDISDASRPIKKTEVDLCAKNGVEYVELPLAFDGIAVVVHPKNAWVDRLTTSELKTMWEPAAQGRVKRWSDVRKGWPEKELRLFGAGVDSGTYDYFTEAIIHEERASRGDFTSSEDDNVLVSGVAGDELALGFFGLAYYEHNRDKLKVVPIDDDKADNGAGPISPSATTVRDGTYQPLSRPIFIYVSKRSLERADVAEFVQFYLREGQKKLIAEVGYIPLPERAYPLLAARVDRRVTGSLFQGKGSQVGVSIEAMLERQQGAGR